MPSAQSTRLTITETDEVNTPCATYIYSETSTKGRVDILPKCLSNHQQSTSLTSSTWISSLIDVFLPVGYPHSVSKDYLEYQIYDSVQAFSSSIAGLLSSRAVLQGVGVGDAAASPTSALLLQILQDTSGRLATILFAHRLGTALEPECKMYRLAADVFNDAAMVLDCVSPLVTPGFARVAVISGAGVLRALCSVAAGSSKASLSAHFARWGNIGELNAKDSSQETVISLLGMLTGSIVVSHVTSLPATWICLLSLLAIHLATNHRAVRAVQMTSLNRQRANIVFSAVLETDAAVLEPPGTGHRDANTETDSALEVLRPNQVAHRERIFERDGILRWFPHSSPSEGETKIGWCRIGVSMQELLSSSSLLEPPSSLPKLVQLFSGEQYILIPHISSSPGSLFHHKRKPNLNITILLKQNCTTTQQLKAWAHALLVAKHLSSSSSFSSTTTTTTPVLNQTDSLNGHDNEDEVTVILSSTLRSFSARFDGLYVSRLKLAGWDLETSALETRPGRRVNIVDSKQPI